MRWCRTLACGSTLLLVITGCGSDSTEDCISNDVGEVCADGGDGRVTFSARGLEPGSEIEVRGPDDLSSVLPVGPDGSFDMDSGALGFLFLFADTEVTFTVSAVDDDGDRLEGELTVTT